MIYFLGLCPPNHDGFGPSRGIQTEDSASLSIIYLGQFRFSLICIQYQNRCRRSIRCSVNQPRLVALVYQLDVREGDFFLFRSFSAFHTFVSNFGARSQVNCIKKRVERKMIFTEPRNGKNANRSSLSRYPLSFPTSHTILSIPHTREVREHPFSYQFLGNKTY